MAVRGTQFSGSRLTLIVVLTILSALATGAVLYSRAAERIVAAERDKLSALMEVRRSELEEYLDSIREEIRFWAKNRIMRAAVVEFSAAWVKLGGNQEATLQRLYIEDNLHPVGEKDNLEFARDGSDYSDVHARYHYWLRSFLLHRGVYDVFLFDPEGNLVYTSFKELDYATNLVSGKWKDTDLGRGFRAARDNPFPSFVKYFDFAPYQPSHGAPASFISAPVLDDAGGFLGVLAFQFPADRINHIMQFTAGMGETGETYVVGQDLLMRSDSRFSEQPTTLKTKVDTVTARLALDGETGFELTPDYRGIPVFSAYGPLEFEDVSWAVMAEMDESEVMAPALELRQLMLAAGLGIGAVVGLLGGVLVITMSRPGSREEG